MRYLLALCLFGWTSVALAFPTFAPATVLGVIDGDTVWVAIPINVTLTKRTCTVGRDVDFDLSITPQCSLKKLVKVRLRHIDTPEIHADQAKCPLEVVRGQQATTALARLLPTGTTVTLGDVAPDNYSGRIAATLTTPQGLNVGAELIRQGMAQSYEGRGSKPDWCK